MDHTPSWAHPPQSPTHSSPEIPPQTLTSFAQSYVTTTTTNTNTTEPTPAQLFVQQQKQKQQQQRHDFSIGSSTAIETNNNITSNIYNNSNINSNSNNNNDNSIYHSKGSSSSSISLFESAASIDDQSIHKLEKLHLDEEEKEEHEQENEKESDKGKENQDKLVDHQKELVAGLHMLGNQMESSPYTSHHYDQHEYHFNQLVNTDIGNQMNNKSNNNNNNNNDSYENNNNKNKNNYDYYQESEKNHHQHYEYQQQPYYEDKLSSLNPFATSNIYKMGRSANNNNDNDNDNITTVNTITNTNLEQHNNNENNKNNHIQFGSPLSASSSLSPSPSAPPLAPMPLSQIEQDEEELRGYRRTPRHTGFFSNNGTITTNGTDDLESQTKNNGDIHDEEDGCYNGIWHDFEPDYGMLNESYQTTKQNIYKDIELTLGNLQQLESRFEASKSQFHTKIEKEYEHRSYQLDLQHQQLAYRKRTLNEKEPQKVTTFQNKIKLNIGGKIFETTLATLQRDHSSLLATMFSGKHPLEPSSDGSYFIDRDPTHFRLVLNYLRDLRLPPTVIQHHSTCQELLQEAYFYQIDGLIKILQ
ncbi:hypothetical protein BJ944DRAFT_38868 [Cunninghamella echinulata]|nr:hypothetical protein BJ944DRAFT_38868 [Cunninghamella echinulata]